MLLQFFNDISVFMSVFASFLGLVVSKGKMAMVLGVAEEVVWSGGRRRGGGGRKEEGWRGGGRRVVKAVAAERVSPTAFISADLAARAIDLLVPTCF